MTNAAPKAPMNINKPLKVPADLGAVPVNKAPKTAPKAASSAPKATGAPKSPGKSPKPPGKKVKGINDLLPHQRIAEKGRAVQQASSVGSTGKPSVTRSAVSGAAGGAATGAAVGAAFGGVGAVPGAVIGGVLGGAGGAAKAHGGKKAVRAAKRAAKFAKLGGGRQLLIGCFLLCMVIWGLSPLTDKHENDSAQEFLKRGAAIMGTFFILALIGGTGRGMTKVTAGLGSLVTLTLLMSERDVFAAIASKIGAADNNPAAISDAGSADLNDIHVPAPADLPPGVRPDQDYRNVPHDAFGRPL